MSLTLSSSPLLVKGRKIVLYGLMIILVLMITLVPLNLLLSIHPIREAHADFLTDASKSVQATACWWGAWIDGNSTTQYHALNAAKYCF